MEVGDLEATVQATLAAKTPTERDVRDALIDYFGLVGRAFVSKGLVHTDPNADDATMRRLLVSRLALLWKGASSPWDRPELADLAALRTRIEQWSCTRHDPAYERVRRLLDELFLATAVARRIQSVRAKTPMRRLALVQGGGERTAPRGRLRLVRPATTTAVPPASRPSSSPPSSSSSSLPSEPLQ